MDIKKIVFKNLDGSLRKVNIVNSINGIDIPESGAVILDTIKDISADGSSLTVTKSDGSSSKVTLNASDSVKTVNSVEPDSNGNITIPTGTVNSVNNVQPDESGNVLLNVVKTVNNTEPDSNGNVTIDAGKVKTVNSAEPDSNGNIEIPTGSVKTVNNIQPDEQGNVTLSIVKTVNGNTPDISGNVTIDAGTVKTVDGKSPDSDGNVPLNAIKSINGSTPNASGDFELSNVSDITLSGKNLNIENANGNTKTLVLPFSDVKTVNNIQPDENGNVTIEVPSKGIDISNTCNIVGVTDNRNLGEIFYSALPLESSQVHLLNGSVLTDATELYDYLKSIKDTNPDLFTTDEEFNSEVKSTGKCSKFVINTDNKTVRIPKGDENNYIVIKNYDTKFEFNQPFSLLEPKWSDVPLNNLSWLLSNGQVNSSKNYPSVYELLLNEYNSGELKTETVGGVSISFKQLGNGHKIVTDKTAYNSILSKTGTSWYYLLDLEAKTFILPQTNGYMKFGNSNEFIKQSLPNLKGQFAWCMSSGDDGTSAPFSKKVVSTFGTPAATGNPGKFIRYGFDASTYSGVYQDGASVRPNSVQGYLYFYVGEVIGTANSVDLTNLGSFKDFVDLEVGNVKNSLLDLKSDISSYAFPGPKYEELTIPASKTSLIAPENGWFMYQSFVYGSTVDYMFMQNNSNLLQACMTRDIVGHGVYVSLPVKKGDEVYFEWIDSATTRKLRFIYAADKVRE